MIDDCLQRWTSGDLVVEFTRHRPTGTQAVSRLWVIWHLMEHEIHHGGEISLILRNVRAPRPQPLTSHTGAGGVP